MTLSAFPYVGGKTKLADWIIQQMPEHTCYVEPFGGAASVLLNKPRSKVEVYNDIDGSLATFFKVVRDREDELKEWLLKTPYSEELHDEMRESLYRDSESLSELEIAGHVFYLQYSSFGAKRDDSFKHTQKQPCGYWRDHARSYANSLDSLPPICERLKGVSIVNEDYQDVMRRYDESDALMYCDPPYLGTEMKYGSEFDHEKFLKILSSLESKWMVSYTDLPNGFKEFTVILKDGKHTVGAESSSVKERLVMNFNPDEHTRFSRSSSAEEADW